MNRRCPNCHSENDVNSKIHFCKNCGNLLFPQKFIDLGLSVLWSDSYYQDNYIEGNTFFTYQEALTLSKNNRVNWSLPTEDQCKELKKNCKWELLQINNKFYYNVKGRNGNSIILPLAGYIEANRIRPTEMNTSGYFWCYSFGDQESIFKFERGFLGGKGIYYFSTAWIKNLPLACIRPIQKK